ncbi:MAG: hypothetical protein GWP05_02560 [Anaerolineaceae bacterium]|nr:hypothetical protein [Anaerolineaceae bacterium]
MGKFLAWTCLTIGLLMVAVSVLQACILVGNGQWTAAYVKLAFHAIKSALGVALVVFGYRRLKWARAREAYYEAVGGPPGSEEEPDWDELHHDD